MVDWAFCVVFRNYCWTLPSSKRWWRQPLTSQWWISMNLSSSLTLMRIWLVRYETELLDRMCMVGFQLVSFEIECIMVESQLVSYETVFKRWSFNWWVMRVYYGGVSAGELWVYYGGVSAGELWECIMVGFQLVSYETECIQLGLSLWVLRWSVDGEVHLVSVCLWVVLFKI